jgi:hypothetical protein
MKKLEQLETVVKGLNDNLENELKVQTGKLEEVVKQHVVIRSEMDNMQQAGNKYAEEQEKIVDNMKTTANAYGEAQAKAMIELAEKSKQIEAETGAAHFMTQHAVEAKVKEMQVGINDAVNAIIGRVKHVEQAQNLVGTASVPANYEQFDLTPKKQESAEAQPGCGACPECPAWGKIGDQRGIRWTCHCAHVDVLTNETAKQGIDLEHLKRETMKELLRLDMETKETKTAIAKHAERILKYENNKDVKEDHKSAVEEPPHKSAAEAPPMDDSWATYRAAQEAAQAAAIGVGALPPGIDGGLGGAQVHGGGYDHGTGGLGAGGFGTQTAGAGSWNG